MTTVELLLEQLRDAHAALEETMDDVTQEMVERTPPGTANRIGERYVHHATAEDSLVHLFLEGRPPLMSSTWQGKTGATEPRFGTDPEHARRIRVEIKAARQYAHAVYATTEVYLSSLADADLERSVDMAALGSGQVSVWWVITRLVIGHIYEIHGEIAAIKGALGARGYRH